MATRIYSQKNHTHNRVIFPAPGYYLHLWTVQQQQSHRIGRLVIYYTFFSDGAAADSTQSPESKSQSHGESSTTVSGSDKVVKTIEQVGSSDNGVSAVKSSEDIEMIPASTSDGADEQEKEAEVAVQQSQPTPSRDHQELEEVEFQLFDIYVLNRYENNTGTHMKF